MKFKLCLNLWLRRYSANSETQGCFVILINIFPGAKTRYSAQLVIAALNEAQGIGITISEMKATLANIPVLVVDGKSSDCTVEIAQRLGAKVVCQDGFGKGDALAKALEHTNPNIDYIVLTDADHTYPAEYVPTMIGILENNPLIGMVCGNRLAGQIDKEALHKVFHTGNKLLALVNNVLSGAQLQDPLTGLRVVRSEILNGWIPKSKGFDIEVELNYLVERRGYKIQEIPIFYRVRLGKKKLRASHGIAILKRMLMETLSTQQP